MLEPLSMTPPTCVLRWPWDSQPPWPLPNNNWGHVSSPLKPFQSWTVCHLKCFWSSYCLMKQWEDWLCGNLSCLLPLWHNMWVKCQQSMKAHGKARLSGTVFKDQCEPRHQDVVQSHPYCQVEQSLDPSNYQTTQSFYLPISSILKEIFLVIQHAGYGQSGEQSPGANWGAVQTNSVNTASGCNTNKNLHWMKQFTLKFWNIFLSMNCDRAADDSHMTVSSMVWKLSVFCLAAQISSHMKYPDSCPSLWLTRHRSFIIKQ